MNEEHELKVMDFYSEKRKARLGRKVRRLTRLIMDGLLIVTAIVVMYRTGAPLWAWALGAVIITRMPRAR